MASRVFLLHLVCSRCFRKATTKCGKEIPFRQSSYTPIIKLAYKTNEISTVANPNLAQLQLIDSRTPQNSDKTILQTTFCQTHTIISHRMLSFFLLTCPRCSEGAQVADPPSVPKRLRRALPSTQNTRKHK